VYDVVERAVRSRPTAVVAAETTWAAFPSLWKPLLDDVWAAVRSSDATLPGHNVMLYTDDVPNVEVGVEIDGAFSAVGRVVSSALPAGPVATTLHRGPFEHVGAAHEAVIEWCDQRELPRTGVRWEIYGHWDEAAPEPQVEVFYLLRR